VEGQLPGAELLDLLGNDVADDDRMAQVGEAGAGDQPDPPGAEDPDRRPRAQRPTLPLSGRSPRAMASMVSFESTSSSVFTTQ
jgi:hypothetical protein